MSGALEGLRVLDLSRFISGPYCAMMLGDMGAEVIKIEKPGSGELVRSYEPALGGNSLYSMVYNRNKKSLPIELRKPEGQALLRELVKEADVLIENFRPGTMEKMGCDWETLHSLNPRLIMARISGFGQDGPFAERPCFDVIAQASSGLMDLTGDPDGPPSVIGTYICDYVTASYATVGILGALQARHRTGKGQVVDVALLDSAVSLLLTAIPERMLMGNRMTRRGNRDRYGPPTASYLTADNDWVYITAGTMFPRFAQAIGRPDLLEDPRYGSFAARIDNAAEVEKIAADWIGARGTEEVLATLQAADLPCAKVATIDDVVTNPQLKHRGQIVEVDHPRVGKVPMQGVTIRLSDTPLKVDRPLPELGQDTHEVLSSWLNYTDTTIQSLIDSEVIDAADRDTVKEG
ncbi:CoA transferase [Pusillimonas sp. MFBS29]|uniref:CaiB/BaiF CoA transferase family protein n=1 Tax=Pusillimonas sp. MFBS29 TaxID=2886690 RepID=UPI001D11060B|nr:CoA transferase [Pusillimonas sp. MFBS29]MCC2595914.1 CoA transferase [Pusillimonas sp. MFBS29]